MILILEAGLALDEFSFESSTICGVEGLFCLIQSWRADNIENIACSQLCPLLEVVLHFDLLQSDPNFSERIGTKEGYYLRPTLFVNCDCLDERTSLFLRALKILLLYCPARLCCFRPLNAIVDGCSKVKVKGRTRS